jgi:hypothetical protein
MAEKATLEIGLDASGAIKSVDGLEAELKAVGKEGVKAGDAMQAGAEKGDRAYSNLGKTAAAAGAAIGAAFVAGAALVLKNTAAAEAGIAQMEAALRSTGGAAGLTSQELQTMAADIQKVSTFGDDAVISMQSLLLTFTSVRGDVFRDASTAIADLATRMGTDLNGAAQMVGKALNAPVEGVAALTRVGVQFTEEQKKMIASLVETGRVADAQRVILRELEVQFGGSAAAARNTMSGALAALKESFGDLAEVPAIAGPITSALNEINENLQTIAESAALAGAAIATAIYAPAVIGGLSTAVTGVIALTKYVGLLNLAMMGLRATMAFLSGPAGLITLFVAGVGAAIVGTRALGRQAEETAAKIQSEFAKALTNVPKTELPALLKTLTNEIARIQREINNIENAPGLVGNADELRGVLARLQGNATEVAKALRAMREEAKDAAKELKETSERVDNLRVAVAKASGQKLTAINLQEQIDLKDVTDETEKALIRKLAALQRLAVFEDGGTAVIVMW